MSASGGTEANPRSSRALVWPSSLRAPGSPPAGFVIGWTESLETRPHRQFCTSSPRDLPNHERVIVAGVIPFPDNCIDATSPLHEAAENEIQDRLTKLRGDSCFCCRCQDFNSDRGAPQDHGRFRHRSRGGKVDSYCSGCVRRFCLENLRVVALYLKHRSKAQDLLLPRLPSIVDSTDGYPWWESEVTRASDEREERQLVLYDDFGRSGSFCLYRGPFFHDDFLIRLTHASLIISTLGDPECTFDADAAKKSASFSQASETSAFSVATPESRLQSPPWCHLSRVSLVARLFCRENGEHAHPLPIATWARLRSWSATVESRRRRGGRCDQCRKSTGTLWSRYETVATDLDRADAALRAKIDILCGLAFGALLSFAWLRAGSALHANVVVAAYFSEIQRGIAWLGRSPVGFKLNERLTERIGDALRVLLETNKALCLEVARWVVDWRVWKFNWVLIPVASSIVGASGGVATLVDAIHLGTCQLSLLSYCFRKVYRVQLYLLAALWRLLRGKKKNVLRNRTDTMEYDSTQLLLGTVLFTIVTTLLSTVFVYHLFFAAACVAVEVCLLPLYMLHLLLLRLPAARLLLRSRTSYFNKDVGLLVHESSKRNSSFDVTSFVVLEVGLLSIAKDYLSSGLSAFACDLGNGLIGLITGSFMPFPPLLGDSCYAAGQTCSRE